ncbi:MAG: dethiobiotin synthase [Myxococcota bacterium]|nr:dethiobiotin synthase [Myxococcota bacterium]
MSLTPPAALLVTGTDTDVGKTVVGSALLAAWRQLGRSVDAYKPVESGVDGEPADGRMLWEACGRSRPLSEVCPTRLTAPLAPPVAARLEGVELDPVAWQREIARRASSADLLLIEGAGGLLSPLWDGGDAATFAQRCELPALVVAADRLGVINHVRLVVEALERRAVPIVAVVLSRAEPARPGDPSLASNAAEIGALIDPPVVGPLPFQAHLEPAALGAALRGCPGADALLPTTT